MHLQDHENKGKAVVLTDDEIDLLLEAAAFTQQRIAFGLGARCGLRSHEIVQIRPVDVVDGPAGLMVKIERGKGDKYRETPIPGRLADWIEIYDEQRNRPIDHPVVDVTTRTVRKWVKEAADRCRAETGDDRWRHLSTHDLRRTWGNLLIEEDVEHGQIMEWGGWENWETFRENYLGRYTPSRQRQERGKVDWL